MKKIYQQPLIDIIKINRAWRLTEGKPTHIHQVGGKR